MRASRIAALLPLGALLAACGGGGSGGPAEIVPVDVPAGPGSRLPSIAAVGDDGLAMIWIDESRKGAPRLLGSGFDGRSWSEPRVIVEDERLFVNWADVAGLAGLDDGSLAVHWLLREGRRSYAYGIRFNVLGADWVGDAEPLRPHRDRSESEHGFVSLIPEPDGSVGLVWLDGRKMEGAQGTMQLLYRAWSPGGFTDEVVLDADVCTCCQTDAALVAGEPFVVYRDHGAGEVRDIGFVRRRGGSWSAPRTLHEDGWKIAGCPVNGPAIDAQERLVAVAWFTQADDEARVLLALSSDGGASFGEPLRLDDGEPLGRVDVKILSDQTVVVTWLEKAEAGAEIRLRPVGPGGMSGEPVTVARTKALRASGFPRMALAGDELFLAWTVPTSPPALRLARIEL